MSDLISRQAAINAIENTDCELPPYAWDELTDAIVRVPSAQPEIIRCRDCRKYIRLGCPMGITVFDAPDSYGYCYKAERRTDEQV